MAQRILKYAILGLLYNESLSGYDITAIFNQELAEFWNAKHSQIYVELNKLLKEEMVSCHIEVIGEKLEKKIYTITEKGKESFSSWVEEEYDIPITQKDVFALKAYYFQNTKQEIWIKQLRQHLEQRKKKLEFLNTDYKSKYANISFKTLTYQKGDYLVLKKAIYREEAYIKWLEEALELTRD